MLGRYVGLFCLAHNARPNNNIPKIDSPHISIVAKQVNRSNCDTSTYANMNGPNFQGYSSKKHVSQTNIQNGRHFPRWSPFGQGQTIFFYYFRQN